MKRRLLSALFMSPLVACGAPTTTEAVIANDQGHEDEVDSLDDGSTPVVNKSIPIAPIVPAIT
ncbi:hypothetical protein [Sphingomonas sp.]|uniref:hypothetical protein n=1 Tax=Sphingomonas sp. TaxID=28214 RepID=UPI0035AF519F